MLVFDSSIYRLLEEFAQFRHDGIHFVISNEAVIDASDGGKPRYRSD